MKTLLDTSFSELRALMEERKEPAFRAKQIYAFAHRKNAASYEEMTNLPKALRRDLAETLPLRHPAVVRKQGPDEEGSVKYLLRYADGSTIEAVLLRYHYGLSLCVSSQVGCRMGCAFCASTLAGCDRNLSAGEMLAEIYAVERDISAPVSHVVVMGSGEPFDNYDALVSFLRMLTDADGHNLSARNITVSTCGLVPEVYRFAKEKIPVNLALSLHAPNDALRKRLMPIANAYSIRETMEALDAYYESNHRRLTIEYSLIAGVNDAEAKARELAGILRGRNVLVNLIPINPIPEKNYLPPSRAQALVYKEMLEKYGINVTIRRGMGSSISAACGQLRKHYLEEENLSYESLCGHGCRPETKN